jgi:HEAT repeat protein
MQQSVLKRLASIWVASFCGVVDPSAALAEVPADLVIDSMEDADRTPWHPEDLGALLQLVSRDPRVQVRARVAELAGSVWRSVPLAAAQDVLAALCCDPSARVRAAAARGLARVIERAAPADRIELISAWTASAQPQRRAAVARALCAPTPMFVTDLAIEQLAGDPVAEVRSAALEAAAAHFQEAPSIYARIAEARSQDEDEGVRHAARRLLMRR